MGDGRERKCGERVGLGDVLNGAIRDGLRIKSCGFSQGDYIDIGTVADLNSALQRFHL